MVNCWWKQSPTSRNSKSKQNKTKPEFSHFPDASRSSTLLTFHLFHFCFPGERRKKKKNKRKKAEKFAVPKKREGLDLEGRGRIWHYHTRFPTYFPFLYPKEKMQKNMKNIWDRKRRGDRLSLRRCLVLKINATMSFLC